MNKRVLMILVFGVLLAGVGSAATNLTNLYLNSTFESLDVRVNFIGDLINESDLILEYKNSSSPMWKIGHPLAKVGENMFIGSVFFLDENILYDVRVSIIGCTLPECIVQGTIRTRLSNFPTGTGNHYYVDDDTCPNIGSGTLEEPFCAIQSAANIVAPGDVVHVQPGVYYESIEFLNSGNETAYIHFLGEGDVKLYGSIEELARIDSIDNWEYHPSSNSYRTHISGFISDNTTSYVGVNQSRLFNYNQKGYTFDNFSNSNFEAIGIDGGYWSETDGWLYVKLPDGSNPDTKEMHVGMKEQGIKVSNSHYIIIEGFEIANIGSRFSYYIPSGILIWQDASNIIIRNNTIHNVRYGINVEAMGGLIPHNILIEKNHIYDSDEIMIWPWNMNKNHDTEGTLINLRAGGGNVVRNNLIHNSFNGVAAPTESWSDGEKYNFNLDVYDNLLYNLGDDCLEPEGHNINNRFWNNTCKDIHMGISLAPIYSGPVYSIRNQFLNFDAFSEGGSPIKFARSCSGRTYIYHNTGYTFNLSRNAITTSGSFGNTIFRNNIFYGHRYGFENNNDMLSDIDWDHDCIYTTKSVVVPYVINSIWTDGFYVRENTIEEFRFKTGQEMYGTFENPSFASLFSYNISLLQGSPCIDSGAIINNINDETYKGNAPDMGAIESSFTAISEYIGDSYLSADFNGDGIVTRNELDQFIQIWKSNVSITLSNAMDAIRMWKESPQIVIEDDNITDHPINTWVKASPTPESPSPILGWEGAGSFDPYNKLWIHEGGHDAYGYQTPQAFSLWTWNMTSGNWSIQFAKDGPPGTCCIDGSSAFDLANKRYVKTFGAYLGHGYQSFHSVNLRGRQLWLYNPETNDWIDALPPPYDFSPYLNYDFTLKDKSAVYAKNLQSTLFFAGGSWSGFTGKLYIYDAYSNNLTKLNDGNYTLRRDGAGASYDSKRNILVMFGSQYGNDENTWVYNLTENEWYSYNITPRPPNKVLVTYSGIPRMAYDPINDIHLAVVYKEILDDSHNQWGTLETWKFEVDSMQWTKINTLNELDNTTSRSRNMVYVEDQNLFMLENQFWWSMDMNGHEHQIWTYRYSNAPIEYINRIKPPNNPSIETTNTNVIIRWSASETPDIDSYKVYRAQGSINNLTFNEIFETTNLEYTDSNVNPGEIYFYRVSALKNGNQSEPSNFVRTQLRFIESKPIVSVLDETHINVSWQADQSLDIAGYNVYRGLVQVYTQNSLPLDLWPENRGMGTLPSYPESVVILLRNITNMQKINPSLLIGSSYVDASINLSDAPPESEDYKYAVYAYIIRSVNRFGVESGPSPFSLTIPSAPKNVRLRNTPQDEIRWDPNPEYGIQEYDIYMWNRSSITGYPPLIKLNQNPISSNNYLIESYPYPTRYNNDRFWIVPIDSLGQIGTPSVPVWYNPYTSYGGFYEGDWHM